MQNTKNYQLIIFDWDGTLIDSAAFITHCLAAAAADMNLKMPTAEFITSKIGIPLSRQLGQFFPDLSVEEQPTFINLYRGYQLSLPGKSELFPGTADTLHKLTNNYKLALATSKTRVGLMPELERCQVKEFFITSRAGDEALPKPNPQMLLEILTELNIAPADAIMVGDTEFDMQMAVNAGVDAIAVGYGIHSKAQLLTYKPIAVIDDIQDLCLHL